MKKSPKAARAPQRKPHSAPARAQAQKSRKRPHSKKNFKPATKPQLREGRSFPIVGIGASAGGFEAFTQLLEHLPADTGMAYVFVQHLQSAHKSKLTELLSRSTRMPVREIVDNMKVESNSVYVIPPDFTVTIFNGVLNLIPRQKEEVAHPVDALLESLANDRGNRAIAVVLSGTGSDGTAGVKAIKAAGGITFAQSEKSSKFDGMPLSATGSGCVDFVLSPPEIAGELSHIGRHPYIHAPRPPEQVLPASGDELQKIYIILRNATSTDFTYYKETTIRRRIARRMVLHKVQTVDQYLKFLQSHPKEVTALFQDILINVTSFFRDPEAFDLLKQRVFPQILKLRKPEEAIRLWVAGCSTGEETYSLAMSLIEFVGERDRSIAIQIFGTDLNETGLERARRGIYPEAIATDVSSERLRRFFSKADSGYQISKPIRDICVFARHDLTRDPPFSRLDLILCRNVLIYLGSVLQKKVMKVFHYALKPGGWLMLGSSETIGASADLFSLRDKKHKLYARKTSTALPSFNFNVADQPPVERGAGKLPIKAPAEAGIGLDIMREADRLILARFAPPGVLINENMEILQFRGNIENYLTPAPGEASLNLLRMAREGLLFELRSAIQKALKTGSSVIRNDISVWVQNAFREIGLEVIPLRPNGNGERFLLVLFHGAPTPELPAKPNKSSDKKAAPKEIEKAPTREVQRLKQELKATHEYLQSVIEEQEAGNEEIRYANEEIQSSNEELQSTNEELETAKEELQSTNEELTTVNEELQNRNLELSQSNNDLNNLLNNINLPIVMLGPDLRLRRFTPQAETVMNLITTDIGRPISDIKLNVDIPDLEPMIREVVDSLKVEEREVIDRHGHWYLLRVRPYRTMENKIDGAVLALVDIDSLKHGMQQLKDARVHFKALAELVPEPLLFLDRQLKVQVANQAFSRAFLLPIEEVEGKSIYRLGNSHWNIDALRMLLEDLLAKTDHFEDVEINATFPKVGARSLIVSGKRIASEGKETQMILLTIKDKTQRPRTTGGAGSETTKQNKD